MEGPAAANSSPYRPRIDVRRRRRAPTGHRRGQLPAGRVDLGSPGHPYGGVDAHVLQLVTESPHAPARGAHDGVARGGVQRDQVDVGPERSREPGELEGVALLVVDVVDHGPFDGEPPARRLHVLGAGVGQIGQWVALVDRHQGVPLLVVGRVQRDGQVHGQPLPRQAPDPRHHSHRRQRQVASGQAHLAVQSGHRPPDPVIVGQRLPHAHEHDVRETPGLRRPHRLGHLLDDFTGAELALEPRLARGAELARHGAPGLGGHADGDSVRIVHQHRFDLSPVTQGPEPLGRLSVVGREARDLGECPGQRHRQLLTQCGRQLGHLLGPLDPPVQAVPHLPGAKGRLVPEDLGQLLAREIVGSGHRAQATACGPGLSPARG